MNRYPFFVAFCLLLSVSAVRAQSFTPGFNKDEYLEMLRITQHQVDTPWKPMDVPRPLNHRMVYRSPVVGLQNRWDLWTNGTRDAVISVRGTTADMVSWLENGYAAMVPAQGKLKLANDFTFDYHLADNPRASVHVGWLTGTAYLSRDILPKIDSCVKAGIRQFYLLGHSQGAAINYLLTAHLRHLQKMGRIPADVLFKSYCSAAPKPGNLYFAYDYEYATRGGWSCTVINTADWVPEVPFSLQTKNDFNTINPFTDAKKAIRKMKFPINLVLGGMYSQMVRPAGKALKRYQKNLGKRAHKLVMRTLPESALPTFADNNHYVRTGDCTLLYADEAYYKLYPNDDKTKLFIHHHPAVYYYLAQKL